MHSIQSRLTFGLLFSLVALFISLWWLVSENIQELAENYTASRIHHDIETLVSAIDFDSSGNLRLNQERINPIYQRPFSGHYYSIEYHGAVLRSRSLWDQKLQLRDAHSEGYEHSHQDGPEQQPLIVVSRAFNKQGQSFSINVAEDLQPLNNSIQHFKNLFAIIAALALSILLLIQILILRSGLSPLEKIRHQLTELEQGHINHLNNQVPKELRPVVDEINHLLDILHKRLKRSRDAIGDLSHAIKKPLTVLQQLSQPATSPAEQNIRQVISTQVSCMRQLTDRILKRARLAGSAHSGSLFNFSDDLPILLKTLKTMYPHKNIQIQSQYSAAMRLNMDREDTLELLGNLLDNAYKWANQAISIRIIEDRQLILQIEDDGPGCAQNALSYLGKRGVRLDESTHGYGFGLAIVNDIVHDYQGQMSFDRSPDLGGFMVKIELPLFLKLT